jgi:hypothetical protein
MQKHSDYSEHIQAHTSTEWKDGFDSRTRYHFICKELRKFQRGNVPKVGGMWLFGGGEVRPFCLRCQQFAELDDAGDSSHPRCAFCHQRRIEYREDVFDALPSLPNEVPRSEDVPDHARPATPKRRLLAADVDLLLEDLICNYAESSERPEVAEAVIAASRRFSEFDSQVILELALNLGDLAAALNSLSPDLRRANADRVQWLANLAGLSLTYESDSPIGLCPPGTASLASVSNPPEQMPG